MQRFLFYLRNKTALRKKIYNSLEDLQKDLNAWLVEYNELRPHNGRFCYGKKPLQTFLDAKHLALEKHIYPSQVQGDNSSLSEPFLVLE